MMTTYDELDSHKPIVDDFISLGEFPFRKDMSGDEKRIIRLLVSVQKLIPDIRDGVMWYTIV